MSKTEKKRNFIFFNSLFSGIAPGGARELELWLLEQHPMATTEPESVNVGNKATPEAQTSDPKEVTSTITAYLTLNTRLSTLRLRYCLPKINTHQLSSFTELCCCCHCLIKSFAAASLPEYVATHSQLTGYLHP